jgi:hypothetical protein
MAEAEPEREPERGADATARIGTDRCHVDLQVTAPALEERIPRRVIEGGSHLCAQLPPALPHGLVACSGRVGVKPSRLRRRGGRRLGSAVGPGPSSLDLRRGNISSAATGATL